MKGSKRFWYRLKPRAPLPAGDIVELPTGDRRVLRVQKLDGALLRISTGILVERAATTAPMMGGTVLIPPRSLPNLISVLKKFARRKKP